MQATVIGAKLLYYTIQYDVICFFILEVLFAIVLFNILCATNFFDAFYTYLPFL